MSHTPKGVLCALVAVLAFVLAPASAFAQIDDGVPDRVTMKDGSVLVGRIVAENLETITIETASMGRVVLSKEDVQYVFRADRPLDSSGYPVDPDYNSILLVPTPETLPRGAGYFRSFELFFLNFGMAVSDAIDLSFLSLFPISSEFIVLGAGAKVRLLSRDEFPVGLAAVGNFTHTDEQNFGTAGGVVGVGSKRRSLNFSAQRTFSDDPGDEPTWLMLVGGDYQVSERTKFILEYATNTQFIDDDEEFDGILNVGMRWFGDRMSFTLTGFRPLGTDSDGLVLFPLGMFSMHW